eukprot:TRINITY_DN383_c2_g1_i1.p1 TRINITY_DN383_c2_g1~~TRINITY_DN383_c2_g1_i1.p1  ORF type:complete len:410 (+),score=64.07 TRINITY_DN383_c2_g1_i1:53-1282(+)
MNKTLIPGQIHGMDPQNLMEKIVRNRIHQTRYWNEQCAGLSAESLVDKAIELTEIGGSYGGNRKASPFLCLTLKLLQLNPEKEIILEFVKNADYRYLRCLGAFYLRLTGNHKDIYEYLENFYSDYRTIRWRQYDGKLKHAHVDTFMDALLKEERTCDVILPHLNPRRILEEAGTLAPRVSILEEEVESSSGEDESDSESESIVAKQPSPKRTRTRTPPRRRRSPSPRRRSRTPPRRRSRTPPPRRSRTSPRRRSLPRDRDYGRDQDRHRDRDRDRDRYRDRNGRDRRDDRGRSGRHGEADRSRDRGRESRRDDERRDRDRYRERNRTTDRERGRDDERRKRERSPVLSRSPSPEKKKLKPWKGKNAKKVGGSSKAGAGSSSSSGGGLRDMNVSAMNKMRAEIGLAPLQD